MNVKRSVLIGTIVSILAIGIGFWLLNNLGVGRRSQGEPATVKDIVQAPNLGTQKNSDGSIEIDVTPKNFSEKEWGFGIVLDTHSEELNADLEKVTVLADNRGNIYKPIAWEGDPPGGHHREGVLKFQPVPTRPESITIIMSQIGGIEERRFTWQLQ